MYVKRIMDNKILDALRLAWEVFEEDVADTYSEEGVEAFQNFVKYENMLPKAESREVTFFQVIHGAELCGMSAIRKDGHICLLFVRKEWQKKGVARKLFYAMQQYCVIERKIDQMTVNATPNAVQAYQHLGFTITRPEQEEHGIRFVPMMYYIKEAKEIAGGLISKKKVHSVRVFYIVLLIGIIAFNLISAKHLIDSYDEAKQNVQQNIVKPEKEQNASASEDTELHGVESIECYLENDLSYTIKEESYTQYSGVHDGKYEIEFDVRYPQIEGLNSEKAREINQILKDCAMSTVNVLYLEPSESTKEAMIKMENPVLMSGVSYKVTYATEDFISVVFEDHYIAGNSKNVYVDMRTRNINLKDATCYEVHDIIDLSDDFMSEWRKRMKKENPNSLVFDNMKTSECRKVLNGQVLDGKYHDILFLEKNGVQIGITYHYSDDTTVENGWTTAPFSFDEMKEYRLDGQTENDLWNIIRK